MSYNSYKHKSGAQKRKEHENRQKLAAQGQRTIESLGFIVSSSAMDSNLPEAESSHELANADISTATTSYMVSSCLNEESTSKLSKCIANEKATTSGSTQSAADNTDNLVLNTKQKEDSVSFEPLHNFDIGILKKHISVNDIEDAVRQGPEPHPAIFPPDLNDMQFPTYVLNIHLKNKEAVPRDWLVWSKNKEALFCFPCRLFNRFSDVQSSILALETGWGPSKGYRKLYDKLPKHENSNNHRACYVEWRNLERKLKNKSTIDGVLWQSIESQKTLWKDILKRILDVVLHLAERGLAFRGDSHLIGDKKNGNFLGTLELISHYDPLLSEHLNKVKQSQIEQKRMQVHYLSAEIQNEFISCCGEYVMSRILRERDFAKYFSIIVDATPDAAHIEQTTFILRYVWINSINEYEIFERFLEFVNCNQKTGEAIADLIIETLKKRRIPIEDCRGQGYDNGSNMSGAYKGAQARILQHNSLAVFSPCACHSLNLCGVHAAECCPEVITFFGVVQKLYNIFSASPQRWEILKENISVSLHSMSTTRWSARVESVKPFVEKLPGIKKAIQLMLELNLSPETRTDLNGILTYVESFECLLMGSIWLKVLTSINYRSVVLQERKGTVDVEIKNLSSLLDDLNLIRNNWQSILNECKLVAENLGLTKDLSSLPEKRKRKRTTFFDESNPNNVFLESNPEEKFRINVFNILLDCVILNISTRFESAKNIYDLFSILWTFLDDNDEQIKNKTEKLQSTYEHDIDLEIFDEIKHLKAIYNTNFGEKLLSPIELLNKISYFTLDTLFPNIIIALRIFCTIPITVAQAERSFSFLARIKNVLRSTMTQDRLSDLGLLAIESDLARNCDFSAIIESFASRKARKAPLY